MKKADIKRKILEALEKGATLLYLEKHFTQWKLYHYTTKEERRIAKAKHETLIDNIFS